MKFVSLAWAFALAMFVMPSAQAATVFFSDTFPGTSLNPQHWSNCLPGNQGLSCNAGGNWPTDQWSPDNVWVNNGLQLWVSQVANGTRPYTSSIITSFNKFHAVGGWIQAEMKMPSGKAKGYWPAFWMLPATYPNSGKIQNWEIDCEWLGNNPNVVYFTLHGHNGNQQTQIAQFTATSPTLQSQFHDYTFNWAPGRWLEFRFDGQVVGRVDGNVPNEPMFMLLNNDMMASNVNWNGNVPDATTHFPSALQVKYVAVESN